MPIGVARLNLTVRCCAPAGASLTLSVTEACHVLELFYYSLKHLPISSADSRLLSAGVLLTLTKNWQ
jgi:hypothetical protein